MSKEAMKLALEALVIEDLACRYMKETTPDYIDKAITALEEVLAEHAMREVQRLGQEIEQEPARWEVGVVDGVVTRRLAPPQRKPLTYCQECMRPNPIDGTDCAHGIKENT